jgi:hypothetical protein
MRLSKGKNVEIQVLLGEPAGGGRAKGEGSNGD